MCFCYRLLGVGLVCPRIFRANPLRSIGIDLFFCRAILRFWICLGRRLFAGLCSLGAGGLGSGVCVSVVFPIYRFLGMFHFVSCLCIVWDV